ncbi:hypothetical protein ACXHMN_32315 [Rhizobium sp. LEGMi12c]
MAGMFCAYLESLKLRWAVPQLRERRVDSHSASAYWKRSRPCWP